MYHVSLSRMEMKRCLKLINSFIYCAIAPDFFSMVRSYSSCHTSLYLLYARLILNVVGVVSGIMLPPYKLRARNRPFFSMSFLRIEILIALIASPLFPLPSTT